MTFRATRIGLALVLTFGCRDDTRGPSSVRDPVPEVTVEVPRERADLMDRFVDLGELGDAHHVPRRVVAYLPQGYAERLDARFPALYVSDGQAAFLFFDLARAMDDLVAQKATEPWIVVAVDTTSARTEELARQSERYADFLVDTVMPAVASRLRVREDRESTAIMGYSYGGLAAVRAQMRRPERLGRVIAMSPSLWYSSRAVIASFRATRAPLPHRMWVDIGSREGREGQTLPYMVRDARALRDAAIERGMIFGRTLGYYEAQGEAHDMRAAGRRVREALAFALSEVDLQGRGPSSLELHRYPLRQRQLRGTLAIEAHYEGGRMRLTWPPSLVRLELDHGAIDANELVPRNATVAVRIGSLEAHSAR